MAKVSLTLDKRNGSQHKDGRFPMTLYLYHNNKDRRLGLKHAFHEEEWDEENNTPIGVENHKHIGVKLRGMLSTAEQIIQSLELELDTTPIDELKAKIKSEIFAKRATPESTKRKYVERSTNKASLSQYFRDKMERLSTAGGFGNKSAVNTAYNALRKFKGYKVVEGEVGTEHILFVDFDSRALKDFEAYLKGNNCGSSTIRAYLSQIRPLFNEALDDGVIDEKMNPFKKRGFKMPKAAKTKKRALRMEQINQIRALDLEPESYLWKARNYFLFMFNNMGINFIDVVQLKKSHFSQTEYDDEGNLVAGRIHYEREKTEKGFSVKLTQEALKILNEYNIKSKGMNDFIFPYGYENTEVGRKRYEQNRKTVNGHLKKIAKLAGIDEKMTTYYARHSWATIAKRNNYPATLISEALGHADTKTTEIYLAGFDSDVIDDANDAITGG
ncbi:MAG: site-specific integrase [Crocinitomicaceae bacterium]